jgi:hypothetical protein
MLVNRYALNVQDHLTKFVHLKPLHSKEGAEVAKHLFWIFSFNAMFGKEAYNGLECLNLPTESREQVKTVKDLYSVLSGIIFLSSL